MKTLFLCPLVLFFLGIFQLHAAIELSCSEDIEIQGGANQMIELIWTPPIVETDCSDGFQVQQVYGPELGSQVFIGEYYIEYEAFEVCDPSNVVTCGFIITATSDRPQDPFIQEAFPEDLISISTIVDMNNDGALDIVGHLTDGSLVWYENVGDNNWTLHLISTEYTQASVKDLDGDGDQDFIVTFLIDSSHDGLGVLINNNNENYTFRLIYDVIEFGFGSQFLRSEFGVSNIFDVDGDGRLDIQFRTLYRGSTECSACMESKHLVAFQNANFDFSTRTITGRDYFRFTDSGSLKSGDFDGDGDPDFVISYADPEDEIELIRNNGNRQFGSYPDAAIDGTEDLSRVVVIDLDEDGDLDITGNRTDRFSYFSNNGNGSFTVLPMPNGRSLPGIPNFDYDNDGRIDFVTRFQWYENLSNSSFYEHLISDDLDADKHSIIAYKDFDEDGDTDLFVSHLDEEKVYYWENQRIGEVETVLEVTCPEDLEFFGNDDNTATLNWTLPEVVSNCPDAYVINQISGPELGADSIIGNYLIEYEIYDNCNPEEIIYCDFQVEAQSTRPQDPFMQFPFSDELSSLIEIVDYNDDGLLDVIANVIDEGASVFLNEGNNTWTKTLLTENFISYALDMDADGDIDLVRRFRFLIDFPWANEGIEVLENLNDGNFETHIAYDQTKRISNILYQNSDIDIEEIVDMDNNGTLDIVMTVVFDENDLCNSCVENDQNILFNDGGFNFKQVRIFTREDETIDGGFMITGDIDNDGDLDILQGTYDPEETLRVYINQLNQDFDRLNVPQLEEITGFFALGLSDINEDGYLDIRTVILNSTPSALINDGQNNFSTIDYIPGQNNRKRERTSGDDYDGDGDFDLLSPSSQTWSEHIINGCFYGHIISDDLNQEDHEIFEIIDYDGDGDYDLFVEHVNEDRFVYWENKRIDGDETVLLEVTCPDELILQSSDAAVFVDIELPVVMSDCTEGYSIDTLGDLFPGQMYPPGLYTIEFFITDNCNSEPVSCSFDIAIEQIQVGDCPNELPGHAFLGEIEEHKYFLSDEKLNWNDASLAAAKIGTYLVCIEDEAENEFISSRLNELAFIGYSDSNSEGDFAWQNSQEITFENLDTPNSEYGDYAYINFWDGQWGLNGPYAERKYIVELECGNTFDCRLEIPIAELNCFDNGTSATDDDGFFIDVQVEAFGLRTSQWSLTFNGQTFTGAYGEAEQLGPYLLSDFDSSIELLFEDASFDCFQEITMDLPASCSGMDLCPEEIAEFSNFGSFENSNYYLSSIGATWEEANLICQENGGHLVSIGSQEENDFIESVISEIVHIGLSDRSSEGSFEWSDEGVVAYTNFSDCVFCPTNSEDNDFASMNFWDGSWNVDGPFAERRFLMELSCNPSTGMGFMPRLAEQKQIDLETLLVFPNPTSGIASVNFISENEKPSTVKVFDAQGSERMLINLELIEGNNQFKIDLSSYAAGLYFLQIENHNIKIFKK